MGEFESLKQIFTTKIILMKIKQIEIESFRGISNNITIDFSKKTNQYQQSYLVIMVQENLLL
jgi:hypothetical protein